MDHVNLGLRLRNKPPTAAWVVIVALAIGACAGGQPSATAGQPSATAGQPSATAGQPSAAADPLTSAAAGPPTNAGSPGGNDDGDGKATLVLTGDIDETFVFDGRSGNVSPTATLIAAVWTDPQINTMTISGEVANGTRKTSTLLAIGWVIGEDVVSFTSKSGECDVTMEVKPDAISGTFTCSGVKSADGSQTVNATGSFEI